MRLVTFCGALSTPVTKQCPKGRALLPSSKVFTTIAFLPEKRPPMTTTTRPALMNFPIVYLTGTREECKKTLSQ